MEDQTSIPVDTAPAEVTEPDATPPAESQTKMRVVTLNVPEDMPDQAVHAMMNCGNAVLAEFQQSGMVLVFPSRSKKEDGTTENTIGMLGIPVLESEDIKRMVDVGQALRQANILILNSSKASAADQLTVQVRAKQAKDNVARMAKGEIEGSGGVVTAASEPPVGIIMP